MASVLDEVASAWQEGGDRLVAALSVAEIESGRRGLGGLNKSKNDTKHQAITCTSGKHANGCVSLWTQDGTSNVETKTLPYLILNTQLRRNNLFLIYAVPQ